MQLQQRSAAIHVMLLQSSKWQYLYTAYPCIVPLRSAVVCFPAEQRRSLQSCPTPAKAFDRFSNHILPAVQTGAYARSLRR